MIEFSQVRYSYDGATPALDGIDARIASGEFVCVLGGNGSGKSTLSKHIDALLVPDEGRVAVDGMDTADPESTYRIRQRAGMVFQNPDDQLVASLVEDDVAFGPENLGVEPAELRRRVTDCLKEVGLSGFERHETYALSGGQKQRVAIAGALAMEPGILVLDEATAMLDPRGRSGLMRVARELHERGLTIVMVTHFMEEAAEADRVIVLDHGKIACEGTPEEVLVRARELERLNLDVPFAARMSLDLRETGVGVRPCVTEGELAREIARVVRSSTVACEPGAEAEESAFACKPGDAGGRVDSALAVEARTAAGTGDPFPASDGATAPLITFDHVSFTYDPAASKRQKGRKRSRATWGNSPDETWAIHDICLEVRTGEFLGIAGHTGSGKSTVIQHMNGLLHPTVGRVLAGKADLADKRAANEARGRVGVVFQYPEHQLFAETVLADVAFGPRNLGLPPEEACARAREALAQVGLDFDELADRSPFELSGGQQRRVAFAGVLAMRPEVLVLDEPAAGLDPASRRSFLSMIERLHEGGLTVVMVSHNMDDLAALCTRMVVLNQGHVVLEGAPADVLVRHDALKAIGLGTTAAQHLAIKLAEEGLPVPTDRLVSEQEIVRIVRKAVLGAGNAGRPADGAGQLAGVTAGSGEKPTCPTRPASEADR